MPPAVSFWATGLTASLAWQWTRPIPTQLKLIHSRVYAQARGVSCYSAPQPHVSALPGLPSCATLPTQPPCSANSRRHPYSQVTRYVSCLHVQALTLAGLGIAGAVQWLEDERQAGGPSPPTDA